MEIRLLETRDELEAAYRLRYQVYVTEMNRRQPDADHVRGELRDQLDDFAYTFGVVSNGEVIGTARYNIASEGPLGHYEQLYDLKLAGSAYPDRVSISTKIILHRDHRAGRAAVALSAALYRHAMGMGIEFDFADCNDHLVPFFTGLGYRVVNPAASHSDYGRVVTLVLTIHDLEHLERVRSPFAGICRSASTVRATA